MLSVSRPLENTSPPRDLGPELERLFREEYASVVRVARRVLGDADAAEDVAQEVFLSFLRQPPARRGSERGWLRAAAAHGALNHLRGERRRQRRHQLQVVESPGTSADPGELALGRAERDRVRAALARIPDLDATLLLLRHSGLSYREVALATGVPWTQVGTRLRRAGHRLKDELESDGNA